MITIPLPSVFPPGRIVAAAFFLFLLHLGAPALVGHHDHRGSVRPVGVTNPLQDRRQGLPGQPAVQEHQLGRLRFQALEGLVELYEATNKNEEAARWRAELDNRKGNKTSNGDAAAGDADESDSTKKHSDKSGPREADDK